PFLGDDIDGVERAAQRARQPALGRFAADLLVDPQRFANDLTFLVLVEGVIGQELGLYVIVGDDLPAALERRFDDHAPLKSQFCIERTGRRHAELIEEIEHAPDADALAVFAPGPVRVVIDVARQIAADDARTAR